MEVLKLENISLKIKEKQILDSIDLSINEGDFLSITGPSGSGKSSLLKIISSLKEASSGRILYKGLPYEDLDILSLRREIIYSFQQPIFFESTILEDLSFPFKIRRESFDLDEIIWLLEKFNLDRSILYKNNLNLSGGELQRLGLIRSISLGPKILLLDEVSSALDRDNKMIVNKFLKDLNKQGTTIIYISHDEAESLLNSNKLIYLENGKITNKELLK